MGSGRPAGRLPPEPAALAFPGPMRLPVAYAAVGGLLLCAAVAASGPAADLLRSAGPAAASAPLPYERIIPAPARTAPGGPGYRLGAGTAVRTTAGSAEVRAIGEQLAAAWRPAVRLPLPVRGTDTGTGSDGIRLRLDPYAAGFGEEGYRLQADEDGVLITAHRPAGLFHGTQTLRQLLPLDARTVPGGTVTDIPRFAHRAAAVEIAAGPLPLARLERYVDQLARYKINTLRLRLPGPARTGAAHDALFRYAATRYVTLVTDPAPAHGAVIRYDGGDSAGGGERARIAAAVRAGSRVILAPADRARLDPAPDRAGPLRRAYAWNPGDHLPGVPESAVLGVEAPLRAPAAADGADWERRAFPRVLGIAELGWSPAAVLDWDSYRRRLATHGPRLDALGIRYLRSPEVPWPARGAPGAA